MEKYIIIKDSTRKIHRFGHTGRTIEFKIKPPPRNYESLPWVKDAIQGILNKSTQHVKPDDLVGITFCSQDLARGPGWIKFKPACEITFNDVWDMIANIYQSNSQGLNTETFCLGVTSITLPQGRGRPSKFNSFDEECSKRKGIIYINNNDNLCLPRALVTSLAYVDKDPLYKKVRQDIGKMQTIRAIALIKEVDVSIPEDGCGLQELEIFQKYFRQDYSIVVYKHGSRGRDIIFENNNGGKKLNLLYHKGHYNVITSLTAVFMCRYYCEECHIPSNNRTDHSCSGKCKGCLQSPPCVKSTYIKCENCNRTFTAQSCFNKHVEVGSYKNSSICKEIVKCTVCLRIKSRDRKHVCGEIFCKICKLHKSENHLCYMPVDIGKPPTEDYIFIFYDLETKQEKIFGDGLLHEPNVCCFKQACDECIETDLEICPKCGVRLQKLICNNPTAAFMHHTLTLRKKFKDVILIAHYAGKFDLQFLLHYIITETALKPEIIMNGTRLILLQLDNLKFIDSANYFPMALSKLPKSFGLSSLKKGYFPHLFNTSENQNYKGVMPPLEYYDVDNLKSDAREDLITWYKEMVDKNYHFDFRREILEYCVSDTEILAQSCIKFRNLMVKEGGVDPFMESVTLPGACNKIFRRRFLTAGTIGVIPRGGYRWADMQSKIAIQWLLYKERELGIEIVHAARQREVKINGIKVDGYCIDSELILQFHGCYFHGCPRCFKYRRTEAVYDNPSDTLERRYDATVEKTNMLREQGFNVIEEWECNFRRLLDENNDLKTFTENHPILSYLPLNPRDAFYGGRTEATKLYHKTQNNEKINYIDVCSLYPWVNKYCKYPTGHPLIYIGEECNELVLEQTDGLIKCKILPAQNLYHPVLPVKMHNKLMFPLCRVCSEDKTYDICNHSEDERALIGTWVVDEVLKAMQKGYKLIEVYEVWKYQTTCYNPVTKSEGLFSEYISKFLKIKQQASGWPRGCDTLEKKDQYVRNYFEKEGVILDPEQMEYNPGLRQLGKTVITSFWGKLGQRENQGRTSIINDPLEFFNIISSPSKDVNNIEPINDETIMINWGYKNECYDIIPTVNVCLAAFTTAHARLKLLSYLEELDRRVLYYDTDSVIYISRPGDYDIPLGSFLGEMTDELEEYGPGSYIIEFASGGPKLYTYRVFSPLRNDYHDVVKAKGISITYTASADVCFEKLRDMVIHEDPSLQIIGKQIVRTPQHNVVTKTVSKKFGINFHKRRRLGFDSVPYGFKT